jgi:EAL domain-containing protein (putative c-di-GMP-specific phosphodiesterase class I)
MVRTIVNLAKSLDLEIIAEGVETIHQLSQLRQLGCEFGQGYCFASPLDTKTLDDLLGATASSSELFYLLPTDSHAAEPVRYA